MESRQSPMDAMGLKRFQQIKRNLHVSTPQQQPTTLRQPIASTALQQQQSTAWYKLEPMASILATKFRTAYLPSTNCSIDETMVQCSGRSVHTLRMPNKPIDQGYKIFALCDHGYTWFRVLLESQGHQSAANPPAISPPAVNPESLATNSPAATGNSPAVDSEPPDGSSSTAILLQYPITGSLELDASFL